MLSESEKQAMVFLAAVDGIGSATLRRLIDWTKNNQVTLESVIERPQASSFFSQNSKIIGGIHQHRNSFSIESYWRWLSNQKIQVLLSEESKYPIFLKQMEQHPLVLYFRGKVDVLRATKPIAVVGTRRATAYGRRATQTIVNELVQHGATIVSGFMYGIDTIAHQAAIDSGGATIAVLGFGFGQMFPTSHGQLFEEFLHQQVVFVSQFAPNTPASPGNFPARNQVVAGLSLATVVVEAALPSGSMITANFALEEGRTVCAVPGPFDNPYSQGTKWLINQGATLVASGNDILVDAGLLSSQESVGNTSIPNNQMENLNIIQKQLVSLIAGGVRLSDELADQLKLPIEQLSFELTQLEMSGIVRREQDGWLK